MTIIKVELMKRILTKWKVTRLITFRNTSSRKLVTENKIEET